MYAIKTPSFLRPASRPSSPAPPVPRSEGQTPERTTRASMLSFSSFKRSASPVTKAPTPLIQDGSYMEVLNLKLSEAVSKALAQPIAPGAPADLLAGRRPVPPGRGRALGDLISSEVNASRGDPHLFRAVVRTLHRPLSVLVNNLSGSLLPLISSPAFLAPVTPNIAHSWQPNPTQVHAVGLATLAGELLEAFDELGLGLDSDMRADGLKGIRDGLMSIVRRVVDPLVNGLKADLTPLVDSLENVQIPAQTPIPVKSLSGTKSIVVQHPAILTLQSVMPSYARALSRYVTSPAAESILATLLISLMWRGLVALCNRPSPPPSPPTSPNLTAVGTDDKRRGSSATPPTTPPAGRFILKLPSSRPPSPSLAFPRTSTVAADARCLFNLLATLPRPSKHLAREAVNDGFEALSGFPAFVEAIQSYQLAHVRAVTSGVALDDAAVSEMQNDLEVLTTEVPTLIALPLLLRIFVYPAQLERNVPSIIGLSDAAYRQGCLSGFGRCEECTIPVSKRVLVSLKDDIVHNRVDPSLKKEAVVVVKWLEGQIAIAEAEAAEH